MTPRYYFSALFALAALLLPHGALAQTFFTASFSAAQETADVTSDATGTAALALTDEGLRYIISVEGLSGDITGAHFHQAAAGVDGGVVHGITDRFAGTTASGMWATGEGDGELNDALRAALLSGDLYLNIHTADNPAGEIRAQIYPTSGAGLSAFLTPEQETADVTSDGRGTASVQATDVGALYFLTVTGLSGDITGAHFHQAPAGMDGGVVRGITDDFDGTTAFGVWMAGDDEGELTDELLADLLLGNLYFNIHTAANPAGEIRGQINPTGGWGFSATLDPDQETADVTSSGLGTAALTFTKAGLAFKITVDGLSGDITGAHFHNAPAGMDGGVVRGITDDFDGTTAAGVWMPSDGEALTGELIQELLLGNLYLNIHTADNPAGEIRGQVMMNEGTSLAAHLTAAQETADVTSDAAGTATLSLTDAGLSYDITVSGLSGDITGAHFHNAPAGMDGGVVHGITDAFDGTTASGTWMAGEGDGELTGALLEALLAGELYLNIHTADNPGGEIRGQVHVSGGTSLRAMLTNEQETAEVTQEASGTAALTLTDAGLVYYITADGLSGDLTGAHFHLGATGTNGGVVHGITDVFDGTTASGVWMPSGGLTEGLRDTLLAGLLYLNLHTAANPGGEIRGQVLLSGGLGASAYLNAEQETADVTSDGHGTAALTFTEAGLVFDLTVDGLSGDITGAHFHNAPAGMDGGVVRGITDDFDGTTAFGVWRATDAEPLTVEQTNAFLSGNLYLNIHTAANPAGEIRGQINPNEVVLTSVEPVDGAVPAAFSLRQNYPNPFTERTTIAFSLTQPAHAAITVYNVLGQRVATLVDEALPAGTYEVGFDAGTLPSGLYHYRLDADGQRTGRTFVLVR